MKRKSVRVLFSCTGIGLENRGIESFFREAFDGLRRTPCLEARLIRSAEGCAKQKKGEAEWPVWCLPRFGKAANLIGRLTGRSPYAVEQWSSFPGVVREIRRFKPDVVFTSEANLCFLLRRFRKQIGVPFRVLFSNGGPCTPPFDRYDFVQQVAPFYRDEALAAGEEPGKHLMVPYGIHVPGAPTEDMAGKAELRERLGLPLDRPVVLSVGWIARKHKRMHYLIEEVARLPHPRPFLQILGAMDANSPEILSLASELLGQGNFAAKSVPYDEVGEFYRAADVFVLCSLAEGFGRVYLEALTNGLPTIGHKHPVIEYVLGDAGIVADLSQPGSLCEVLTKILGQPNTNVDMQSRWQSIASRFDWEVLSEKYLEMFKLSAADAGEDD